MKPAVKARLHGRALASALGTPALQVLDHRGLAVVFQRQIHQTPTDLVRLVVGQARQSVVIPATETPWQAGAVAGLLAGLAADALHESMFPVFIRAVEKASRMKSALNIEKQIGRAAWRER